MVKLYLGVIMGIDTKVFICYNAVKGPEILFLNPDRVVKINLDANKIIIDYYNEPNYSIIFSSSTDSFEEYKRLISLYETIPTPNKLKLKDTNDT